MSPIQLTSLKVKLLTTFLMKQKWNKAPCCTFFHFTGTGMKKCGGIKPSSSIGTITSLFLTFSFYTTSCRLLRKRIWFYAMDLIVQILVESEREMTTEWQTGWSRLMASFILFLQNVKAREREEWKLIAQRFAVYLKTNLSLNKAKITVLYKSVLSFYLRVILSDFSEKYSLRTILCLWKIALKLHLSIVILLQLSGSFK